MLKCEVADENGTNPGICNLFSTATQLHRLPRIAVRALIVQLTSDGSVPKMNTAKSFWFGWGSLCLAGAGAYYFAKKSINADRAARLEESRRRKQVIDTLEYPSNPPDKPVSAATANGNGNGAPARTDTAGSPSQEASRDPAPTRHAPATEGQQVIEKSKYESSTPFKSPKGDRFS
ncbi:hypothetical protein GGS23DRAFT_547204 [Durotheca rogersii]|uniref:uncharacterized protein n=1 Tax=Durotheca rogersii TaxID=419775 RepID=UPI0022207099|nr:uncharacterized protein GGS23DRAFT_547204 [Durotheca rogersii]KAI5867179.1 hypothetical protein GGS23DRAFT_547204 [Durotheca rogersii]